MVDNAVIPKMFTDKVINDELAELNKNIREIEKDIYKFQDLIAHYEDKAEQFNKEKMKVYETEVAIRKNIWGPTYRISSSDISEITSLPLYKLYSESEARNLASKREMFDIRIEKMRLEEEYEKKKTYKEALLRKTPRQRAEEHYQALVDKKNAITKEKEFPALAKKFREMEGYKDTEALADECEELVFKVQYDRFIQAKDRASNEEDYRKLAKLFWRIKDYKDSEVLAKECEELVFKIQYDRFIQAKNRASTEEDYRKLAKLFKEIKDYRDSMELAIECDNAAVKAKYNLLIQEKNNASTEERYIELAKKFREMNGYENADNLAIECDNAAVKARYNLLVQEKNNASTEKEYQELAKKFREMNDYEDTEKLAIECDNQYSIIKELRIKKEKWKARKEVIITLLPFICILGTLFIWGMINLIQEKYNNKMAEESVKIKQQEEEKARQDSINAINKAIKLVKKDTMKDKRDGKTYKTVKIGEQTWIAENLNYAAKGSKCYENNSKNCEKYGRLYNWKTALKVCPEGWHLPTKVEWNMLYRYTTGKYLKSEFDWNESKKDNDKVKSNNGDYSFGFTALPGGHGSSDGYFFKIGNEGNWWSASENNVNRSYSLEITYNINAERSSNKSSLLSVRCVKD